MSSKSFRITLLERSFDVEVLDDPNQPQVRVRVNGKVWPVQVEDLVPTVLPDADHSLERAAEISTPSAAIAASVEETKIRQVTLVKAPLPGVISAIYVQADQPVRSGEQLCAIETMKMNNVIQAPAAGVIGRICVSQGQAVNFDQPLIEIRP